MTQTKTTSATGTAVVVATAVLVATVVGTAVGITQWQNKAALVVDDLSGNESEAIVLRSPGISGSSSDEVVANVGDMNGDGFDDLAVSDIDGNTIYVHFGGESTISETADVEIASDLEDFGYSLAGAGDVNADGYADMIIGARSEGDAAQGLAAIYYGSSTGPTTGDPDWSVAGADDSQYFGQNVAGLEDINADGYDDVAVYTGLYNASGAQVAVFYGSASGPSTTADWTYSMSTSHFEKTNNLSGVGDVNADGYADMAVGNPEATVRGYGSVEVFYGSSTGFAVRPNFFASHITDAWFGATIAKAGDVNADGYDDIIIGAPFFYHDEVDEGGAFVYFGSSTGLSRFNKWKVESNIEEGYMGISAAPAMDVNADGYDDILVTAPYVDRNSDGWDGNAFIFGGAVAMSRRPLGIEGEEEGVDRFGLDVTTSTTLVGADSTDVVFYVENYDDGTDSTSAVIIYPNLSL